MLSRWIVAHMPAHRIYCEPFGGAASILMQKPRCYSEVYNDLNDEVVTLFRVLRDPEGACELERRLRLTPYARREFEAAYLPSEDAIEVARKLIIRSFMGHGADGCLRKDWKTGFRYARVSGSSPEQDWRNYPDALAAMSERLQGVIIECRPAVKVLAQFDSLETLHYCDPPYPHGTRVRKLRHVYPHEMTDDQHRELAAVLRGLRGMVMISGYPCDLYDRELYAGWHRVQRRALADMAKVRTEVLWLNDSAAAHVQKGLEL